MNFRHAIGLVFAATLLLTAQVARSGTCSSDTTIGGDPDASDTLLVEYLSRCVGQVFTVSDTLLVSLTIWRPALPELNGAPRHLFIVDVDSAGVPIPTVQILDGPVIENFVGDGVHPVPYRFEFDPPFALPRRGRFCFVVTFEVCSNAIAILGSNHDLYAGGRAWEVRTNNFANCAYPVGSALTIDPGIDIIFQAELCDTHTPTRPQSWGQLKVRYR